VHGDGVELARGARGEVEEEEAAVGVGGRRGPRALGRIADRAQAQQRALDRLAGGIHQAALELAHGELEAQGARLGLLLRAQQVRGVERERRERRPGAARGPAGSTLRS
jgi:hypothetical protein